MLITALGVNACNGVAFLTANELKCVDSHVTVFESEKSVNVMPSVVHV